MKKLPLILFVCLLGANLTAQISITGIVRDSLNNPISFASVYLSNTTIGTTADNSGAYKLKIPKDGQYELIITCIGYKSYSKSIHAEGKNIVINAILQTNTQTLNEITVTAKDKYRKQNYSWFIKVFFGETPNSKSCSILNPEDIRLHYNRESKKLTGYSVKPLVIENRALGYKIIYDLKNFEHYPNKGISRYYGCPFFSLMNGSESEQESWSQARLITYYGSQMHFMRTLYNDKINMEKFEMYEENIDKATNENINTKPLNVKDLKSFEGPDHIVIYSLKPVVIYYDNPELKTELNRAQSYRYKSVITFNNSLKVFENGYFEHGYNISWDGKMSKERMADMLPFDFQPDL